MQEVVASTVSSEEVESLARLLVEARQHRIAFFQEKLGISASEATAMASRRCPPEEVTQLMETPADQLGWAELGRLIQSDPEQGTVLWQQIKQAARNELLSGHRAAKVVDWDSTPWARARFIAIRDSFIDGLQPRNAVELALVDGLAQAYALREFWIERLNVLSTTLGKDTNDQVIKTGKWELPLVSAKEALDQAVEVMDCFDRSFARNVRALRDLRRYGPVVIQNASQVNVAREQLNVAQVKE